jgi:hypothetical protein
LSILESSRHELLIAHGLSLMTLSPRGWEAFPTPGARTHTRITWAFSPPALQVPGVTSGSPLCPWCSDIRFGEVRNTISASILGCHSGVPFVPMVFRASFARHSPLPNGVDAFIDYTHSRCTNSRVAILCGAALCLP